MGTAITDVPRRDDKEISEKVPQQVETPSVQAQLDEDAFASSVGGKQDEDTFPSVQAQLDEFQLSDVNVRLQEGTTW